MKPLSALGRFSYWMVRFVPGGLGSCLRVNSLRMQGLQVGQSVSIGLGTSFHLPNKMHQISGGIGHRVIIDEFCDFSAGVHVGDDVSIGKYVSCIASPPNSIVIGNDCLIAKSCFIRTDDHIFGSTELPFRLQGRKGSSIHIGENVWLGVNVVVLKNSCIGSNTVIGACSLVNCSIPSNVVAVGVPARPIKTIEAELR